MKKTVMVVLISHRHEAASKVQAVLTGWGCMIKTRLGIHQGVEENCSENGLLFLDLVGDEEKISEFERKLSVIRGVSARKIDLEVPED